MNNTCSFKTSEFSDVTETEVILERASQQQYMVISGKTRDILAINATVVNVSTTGALAMAYVSTSVWVRLPSHKEFILWGNFWASSADLVCGKPFIIPYNSLTDQLLGAQTRVIPVNNYQQMQI